MTRADFYDWLMAHGCQIEPLKELTTGNAIRVTNPQTGSHCYFSTPIDNRHEKHFLVCRICSTLGIPIPGECKYMEPLHDHIKNKHHPNR